MFNEKELGNCDIYPLSIKHNPNGLLFCITDHNEFFIYKSQTFSNVAFGTGSNFVWSYNGGYAVKEDNNQVSLYDSSFKHLTKIISDYPVED